MNFLKRFYIQEKKLMEKPGTILAVWIAFGVLFGVGIDNVGAGIAVGVAIGVALSATKRSGRNEVKDEDTFSSD